MDTFEEYGTGEHHSKVFLPVLEFIDCPITLLPRVFGQWTA